MANFGPFFAYKIKTAEKDSLFWGRYNDQRIWKILCEREKKPER
jgi:hypothetical protein